MKNTLKDALKDSLKFVLPIFLWYFLQIYAQQLDYWRKQSDVHSQDYREILLAASEIVSELYPAVNDPKRKDNKEHIDQLLKHFETLYWARSSNKRVEGCLKGLRRQLINAGNGGMPYTSVEKSQLVLQKNLSLVSQQLSKDYEKTSKSWFLFFDTSDKSSDQFDCNSTESNR